MKKFFEKKISQCQKSERDDPLGVFNIHFVAKIKKLKRTLWGKFCFKKSFAMPKKLIGGPFGLVWYRMLRRKRFGSVPWASSGNLKFCRTFGRTILVTSGVSTKTLTKRKAPTKNNLLISLCR